MKKKFLVSAIIIGSLTALVLAGCSRGGRQQPSPANPPAAPPAAISPVPPAPSPDRPTAPVPSPTPPAPPTPQSEPSTVPRGELPLRISQPVDGSTLTSPSVAVKGQTKAGATVAVNDEIISADDQGNFSVSVNLKAGPNAIDVVAMDEDGNENEVLLIVNATGG